MLASHEYRNVFVSAITIEYHTGCHVNSKNNGNVISAVLIIHKWTNKSQPRSGNWKTVGGMGSDLDDLFFSIASSSSSWLAALSRL